MSKKAKTVVETAQDQTDQEIEAGFVEKDEAVVPETQEKPVVLKAICKELGLDPKLARRKLRKAWRANPENVSHSLRDRWTGDYIRSILKPEPKQEAATTTEQ